MAERSHVSSVEAIEAFRASVIVFLAKARPTVEEVSSEVVRMGLWLENNQRDYWVKEIRRLTRKLEEAQAELFTARLDQMKGATALQEMAVHRVKRELREAEDKLAVTKKWSREIQNFTQPLLKEVEQLHTFFTTDMVRAIAYLAQVVKTLDAYAGVAPPGAAGAAAKRADSTDASLETGEAASSPTNQTSGLADGEGERS